MAFEMKSEAVFGLDTASWPALLVDGAGVVRHANPAAKRLFAPALDSAAPRLSAIWVSQNALTAEQFIATCEPSSAHQSIIKFRDQAGQIATHLVPACAFHEDGEKQVLLQLLPHRGEGGASEGSLAHKQKLDCALQLARTVALDFNNALTIILGHTSLVLTKMEPTHPWRGSLIEVEKSAAKAAEIASDLGTFSRQEKEARTQAAGSLNNLLQRSVEFFQQNAKPESVTWALQFERKLFAAKFDEAKMQQAFLKILENALQSFHDRGRIAVQTRNIELTAPTQDRNVQLAPGAYVCAEISDNGCGIEADVLPRVFEPFFTTKKAPNHRGLGLAWVYGIVTNHGGGVALSSKPGAGTSVRVYLPAEKRIARDNSVALGDLHGDQTVLMVDDEDLLLTMGQTILSAYGYRVLTANGGHKALEILQKHDPPVDLIITDLVMPAMSGRELVEEIHRVSPGTRIICMSGYVWPSGQEDNGAYLQKPFSSQELLAKVKSVLTGET
jgi:signal transduction histidine kinase